MRIDSAMKCSHLVDFACLGQKDRTLRCGNGLDNGTISVGFGSGKSGDFFVQCLLLLLNMFIIFFRQTTAPFFLGLWWLLCWLLLFAGSQLNEWASFGGRWGRFGSSSCSGFGPGRIVPLIHCHSVVIVIITILNRRR